MCSVLKYSEKDALHQFVATPCPDMGMLTVGVSFDIPLKPIRDGVYVQGYSQKLQTESQFESIVGLVSSLC